jgi:hypothetical protein
MAVVELVAAAFLFACIVRVALIVRPLPNARLPHPSKVAGMPMAGPASVRAAHAALSRKGAGSRPKFRT